ncbi:hypothetical protein HPB49_020056 [Dermacentor silvarum]|uniref:Uncharacterized protein n=1 Tax=Dermacentor silvarum TaxID=543639 RepID=A0ACB8E272_DERSI|nr:hypothetical protein HPB49_020056 [Dermacentor silvarum]
MAYQVEGASITPAELEADSRWIRGVKAHRAAAAHQAIASTPPASPPSKTPTPPPAATPSTTTLRRHAPLPRLPAEDLKIVFRRGGGLDLRTTTNGALLEILCTLATARTADRVRINPYNSLTVSTPSEPRARLYLRVSELRLGPTSYPLRTYMAAPDNALRGIIYNAVDSQTQDEMIQDLQAMNVNTPYAIADARQMGRSLSILITFVGTTTLPSAIVFNCGIYRCHPFRPKTEACTNCWAPGHRADVCTKPKSTLCHRCGQAHKAVEPPTCVPCCILCKGAHVTGSRPCKLRFDRNGPSSPPATSKHQPPPPAPPTGPIHKTSRPSRRRSPSRGARSARRHRSVSFPPLPRSEASTTPTTTSPVSWKSQPHTSDPQTAALKATIAAQQLQIQELSRQLQAALARLSSPAPSPPPCPATAPSQTPPQPAPAVLGANEHGTLGMRHRAPPLPPATPPHKRRSPSSDDVAPERDIVRKTTSLLEAFEQRVMARFVRLEERIASVDNRVATIEFHLTALDTRVAVLEARQSATEATLAHLSLPAPLTPAPTPTPTVDWDRFRSTRLSSSSSAPITDLSAWTETLLADVHAATSTLPAAPHSTTADSRLLHLCEAYHAVHRRWQAQKHNRRLRLRLARLASDMKEHCSSLLRQQWGQTCNRIAGNLGLRDTWSLLRVLLDPTHTKASQRNDISHLLHSSPLTDTDFLAALRARYLCTDPPTTLPAYTGSPNPDLEADISLGEWIAIVVAIMTVQGIHKTPGLPDMSSLHCPNSSVAATEEQVPSLPYVGDCNGLDDESSDLYDACHSPERPEDLIKGGISELVKYLAPVPQDYSYFTDKLPFVPHGPEHWRLRIGKAIKAVGVAPAAQTGGAVALYVSDALSEMSGDSLQLCRQRLPIVVSAS